MDSNIDSKRIIMNFSMPPSLEDMEIMAAFVFETLPQELGTFCETLKIAVEDFPDEALEQELDIDDPYELLALYRSGKEISPGVEKKTANDDDALLLFRRPILDMWCETGDDLGAVLRQVMVEELGKYFEFSEEEIDEMAGQNYQDMI